MKKVISMIMALVLCLSLTACGSGAQKKDVHEEIRITVQAKAAVQCMVEYKDVENVMASVTDCDDNGDGTYDVKGYITVIDSYGDRYKAKYTAVVAMDDDGDGTCKKFNMDTPTKDR